MLVASIALVILGYYIASSRRDEAVAEALVRVRAYARRLSVGEPAARSDLEQKLQELKEARASLSSSERRL